MSWTRLRLRWSEVSAGNGACCSPRGACVLAYLPFGGSCSCKCSDVQKPRIAIDGMTWCFSMHEYKGLDVGCLILYCSS